MVSLFRFSNEVVNPKCIVYLLHGYSEHVDRFSSLVDSFAGENINFYGHDHRGFGRTTIEDGTPAHIDNFEDLVDDAVLEITKVKRDNPRKPIVVLGYSMGGLVATRVALRMKDDIDGTLLVSPALRGSDASVRLSIKMTWCMLCSLALLFPKFELPGSGASDLTRITRNGEEAQAWQADTLVWHGGFRVGLLVKLIQSSMQTREEMHSLTVPTYIYQGTDDRICNPAGSRLMKQTLPDLVTLNEYQGAVHDLLHELPQVTERVVCDIRTAINAISSEYTEPAVIRGEVIKRD